MTVIMFSHQNPSMTVSNSTGKERLVVEVVATHNIMPKDGEGSSSPFVEIEFENQRLRTQVKYKDLNPVWNEKLVFRVKDVADLPYRAIEVNIFNERRSGNSRNFLGKVRVSGSNIAKEGEEIPQLYTLDKRSLFSHIRGEISLKLYLSTREEVKEVGVNGIVGSSVSNSASSSGFSPSFSYQRSKKNLSINHTHYLSLSRTKLAINYTQDRIIKTMANSELYCKTINCFQRLRSTLETFRKPRFQFKLRSYMQQSQTLHHNHQPQVALHKSIKSWTLITVEVGRDWNRIGEENPEKQRGKKPRKIRKGLEFYDLGVYGFSLS